MIENIVFCVLLSWSKELELSISKKSRVNNHIVAELLVEHRFEKVSYIFCDWWKSFKMSAVCLKKAEMFFLLNCFTSVAWIFSVIDHTISFQLSRRCKCCRRLWTNDWVPLTYVLAWDDFIRVLSLRFLFIIKLWILSLASLICDVVSPSLSSLIFCFTSSARDWSKTRFCHDWSKVEGVSACWETDPMSSYYYSIYVGTSS